MTLEELLEYIYVEYPKLNDGYKELEAKIEQENQVTKLSMQAFKKSELDQYCQSYAVFLEKIQDCEESVEQRNNFLQRVIKLQQSIVVAIKDFQLFPGELVKLDSMLIQLKIFEKELLKLPMWVDQQKKIFRVTIEENKAFRAQMKIELANHINLSWWVSQFVKALPVVNIFNQNQFLKKPQAESSKQNDSKKAPSARRRLAFDDVNSYASVAAATDDADAAAAVTPAGEKAISSTVRFGSEQEELAARLTLQSDIENSLGLLAEISVNCEKINAELNDMKPIGQTYVMTYVKYVQEICKFDAAITKLSSIMDRGLKYGLIEEADLKGCFGAFSEKVSEHSTKLLDDFLQKNALFTVIKLMLHSDEGTHDWLIEKRNQIELTNQLAAPSRYTK